MHLSITTTPPETNTTKHRGRLLRTGGAILLVLGTITGIGVVSTSPAAAEANGLALTPPMGFNDWNAYKCNVSAQLIEQTADTMVSSGMKAAGYQYVNIDDCWLSSTRAADGSLVADPAKFPDGIKAVADYVHARGLKLGIYEDAGTMTCAGYPGSLGHEAQDAKTFASWDVDYLKYDQCNIPFANYPGLTHEQIDTQLYTTMSKALQATGRKIVFSMCNGTDATALPWLWGAPVSNLWRTTTDIQDNFASMVGIVNENAALAKYAKPGAWNDPDMLEIGNGGMTDTEYRSEFSLWSEMAAPLIAGTTLTTATPATLAIYTNKDVIAVDQDRLGKQGRLVSDVNGKEVFAKPLANGDVAVALFNSTDAGTTISTRAGSAGLRHSAVYSQEDLWSKQVSETAGTIGAYVPAHATVLYRVSTPRHPAVTARSEAPNTTLSISTNHNPITTGESAQVTVALTNNGVAPLIRASVALTVPSGWTLTSGRERHSDRRGHDATVRTGSSMRATFRVNAPSSAPPISTADLTADATYRSVTGKVKAESIYTDELVSPVTGSYRTADTTGAGAVFGQSGDAFAISAAGTGVNQATTTTRGTTAASDQYGAIYLPGAADSAATATTTVTAQPAGRTAKAGLMMRNDATSAAGSPEGVVLYVTGTNTVAMAWNVTGGADVDTASSASSASSAQTLPIHLKLVRAGSSYTGYWSVDGTTWTAVATATVAAAASAPTQDVALFHTSGSAQAASEADFTGLTVTG